MTRAARRYLVALVGRAVSKERLRKMAVHMRLCGVCRTYKQARDHLGLEWT